MSDNTDSISYHLTELAIAMDKGDPRRSLPKLRESDKTILDIGCGIGQSFIGMHALDRVCIGLDIDERAIAHGMQYHGDKIHFIYTDASRIPLPRESVDLVISRVSLPYTRIPRVVREVRRVLRKGGRFWLTLHSKAMVRRWMKQALARNDLLDVFHKTYVLFNGYVFSWAHRVLPYVNGKYESWQDMHTMQKLFRKNGFATETIDVGGHAAIEATKT